MTSSDERIIKPGFETTAPRTSEDFARRWTESPERQELLLQIEEYIELHPLDGDDHKQFALSRRTEKSKKQREKSPYTLSYWRQVNLCLWRNVQLVKNEPSESMPAYRIDNPMLSFTAAPD